MSDRSAALTDMPAVLEHEGRRVLAIPVGLSRNEFALAKLRAVRSKPGWIVRGRQVSEWRLEGFFTHAGRLYLHGPYLPGRPLEEALGAGHSDPPAAEAAGIEATSEPEPEALRALRRLVEALQALEAAGVAVEELQTDAVYLLEDGGLLLLPPELMRELRHLRPEAHRLRTYQGLNHPDLGSGLQRLSFCLAALLHRLLRGAYPFQADTEEDLRNRMRHQKLSDLTLSLPGLRPEIAQAVLRGLGRAETPLPDLERWSQLLARAQAEGFYRPLSPAEREDLRLRARKEQERARRGYRARVFWQRHWKTVLIAAAAVVVAGALGGSYLKNLLAPRLTRGYSPRQVVEAFYGGFNSLDHALMEDCVVDRAGKEAIREVINVYVLSRVSLGYEGKSHILSAEQWLADGRPELDPADSVYGVTDLELRQESQEPGPVFLASYTKWAPTPGGVEEAAEPPAAPRFERQAVRERVYLRRQRQDWVIYRFQRL